MNPQGLFECLGYLAAPQRRTRIDIELPERKRQEFEQKYEQLTGNIPHRDNQFYYVWPDTANKWGIEMRLYFIENNNLPDPLRRLRVSSTYYREEYRHYNARINKNDFIWQLIEHGFRIGDSQDLGLIRNNVPQEQEYEEYFNRGLNR